MAEEVIDMKEVLKEYLNQYYRKRKRKMILQDRLDRLRLEMIGAKSQRLSGMPHSTTNNISNEPLDFVIKQEQIIMRLRNEEKESASAMLKIMDMINFLECDSDERNILELRYIDNYPWKKIEKLIPMSRSRCNDYLNIGLDKLLSFKKVQKILEEFMNEQG